MRRGGGVGDSREGCFRRGRGESHGKLFFSLMDTVFQVCRRFSTHDDGLRIQASVNRGACSPRGAREKMSSGAISPACVAFPARRLRGRRKGRARWRPPPKPRRASPPPRPGCDCRECARDRPPIFLPPPRASSPSPSRRADPTLKILPPDRPHPALRSGVLPRGIRR